MFNTVFGTLRVLGLQPELPQSLNAVARCVQAMKHILLLLAASWLAIMLAILC